MTWGNSSRFVSALVHHRQIDIIALILKKTTQSSSETSRSVSLTTCIWAALQPWSPSPPLLHATPKAIRTTPTTYTTWQVTARVCICIWARPTH